jgi:hypothetical protein
MTKPISPLRHSARRGRLSRPARDGSAASGRVLAARPDTVAAHTRIGRPGLSSPCRHAQAVPNRPQLKSSATQCRTHWTLG